MPNEPTIDLSILSAEPAGEYHAKAAEFLSSHQLIDFMRCPYLYAKKRAGLVVDKESPAYLIGRAAHCRILEGRDVYESEFALGGPINPTTGKRHHHRSGKGRSRLTVSRCCDGRHTDSPGESPATPSRNGVLAGLA